MEMQVNQSGSLTVARIGGEIAQEEVERFTDQLQELVAGEGSRLAVDLSGLQYINSSGLAALIHLVTRSRLGGGRVVLVAPSGFVSEVLSITRLDSWFEVYPSIEEARTHIEQE